jgi:hypothetical protein
MFCENRARKLAGTRNFRFEFWNLKFSDREFSGPAPFKNAGFRLIVRRLLKFVTASAGNMHNS